MNFVSFLLQVIRGLRFGGDGGQIFAAAVPKLQRLRVLDLRGTRVGDKGKKKSEQRNKRGRRKQKKKQQTS